VESYERHEGYEAGEGHPPDSRGTRMGDAPAFVSGAVGQTTLGAQPGAVLREGGPVAGLGPFRAEGEDVVEP